MFSIHRLIDRFGGALLVCLCCACSHASSPSSTPLASDPHGPVGEHLRLAPQTYNLAQVEAELAQLERPARMDSESWEALKSSLLESIDTSHAGKTLSSRASSTLVGDLHLEYESNGDAYLLWTYANCGDYNQDGLVSVSDLTVIGQYWLASLADDDWPAAQVADGDGNGLVNAYDITPLGANFLNSVEGYQLDSSADGAAWIGRDYVWLDEGQVANADKYVRFTHDLGTAVPDRYWRVTPLWGTARGLASPTLDSTSVTALARPFVAVVPEGVQIAKQSSDLAGQKVISSTSIPDNVIAGYTVYSEADQAIYRVDSRHGNELVVSTGEIQDAWQFLDLDLDPANTEITVEFEPIDSSVSFNLVDKGTSDVAGGASWLLEFDKALSSDVSVTGSIEGSAELQAGLTLGSFWRTGKVDRFHFGEQFELELKALVDIHKSAVYTDRIPLGRALYCIKYIPGPGGVPIVLVVQMPVTLVSELTAAGGFRFGPTATFTHQLSVDYTPATGWVFDSSKSFVASAGFQQEFYFEAELELAVATRTEILLYNLVGPYVELRAPSVVGKVEKQIGGDNEFKASIKVGAKLSVGVTENIPFLNLPSLPYTDKYEVYDTYYLRTWSETGSVEPVQPPAYVAVSQGDDDYPDAINIDWGAPPAGPNPDSYTLRRTCVAGPDTGAVKVYSGCRLSSYLKEDVTDGGSVDHNVRTGESNQYRYAVASAYGSELSAYTTAPLLGWAVSSSPDQLQAPTGLQASDGTYQDRVRLTWSHPGSGPTPDGYRIFRNGAEIAQVSYPSQLYEDHQAAAGTTYTYKACSYKSGQADSGFSNSDTGARATTPVPLNPPSGLLASDGNYTDQVVVTWSNPTTGSTPEQYVVYRNNEYLGSVNHPQTSYQDLAAVAGTTYSYKALSRRTGLADSGYSNSDTGYRAVVPEPLSPPASLTASDGAYTERVRIAWSHPVSGSTPAEYYIYRDSLYIGQADYPQTYFDDQTAVAGTVYTYKARSRKAGLTDSGDSNSDTGYRATVPEPLSPPANLAASDGTYTDKVRVSWSHPGSGSTPEEYYIYRDGAYLGAVDYPATTYDDFSAATAVTYAYQARSRKPGLTDSGLSSSDTGYRAAVPDPLNPPAGLAATDGSYPDKVRVSWSHPSSGATPEQYRIYRNGSYYGSVGYPATYFDDTSVVSGTSYSYKATSSKSGWSESGYSNADSGYAAAANQSPTVQIKNPSSGAVVSLDSKPSAICLDPDGEIASVKFYIDGILKDTQTGYYHEPGWYLWGNFDNSDVWNIMAASAGTHSLQVVATDDEGATGQHTIYVTVENGANTSGTYKADFYYQSDGVMTIPKGTTKEVTVQFQNLGTATWYNYGPYPVRLASSNHINGSTPPTDKISPFWDVNWLKHDRIEVMDGDLNYQSCPPWGIAEFTIKVHVPYNHASGGPYQLNWNLVSDCNTWIKDKDGEEYGNYFVQIYVP
ncbi:hypothetical protein JW859_06420 [bacterium]|nr:hypothetical protein [bacterium]